MTTTKLLELQVLSQSSNSRTFNMSERTASVERQTSETQITCTIVLDNEPGIRKQEIDVSTGIGFLDHVG